MKSTTHHAAPPPGYFVLDSPNDGENGTYSCPYSGCDGIVCGSIQDCHLHERDWHSPPYSCAECGASFAANPALSRHIRASSHQRWVCEKKGCDIIGIEFESHLDYLAHITSSAAHRGPGHCGEDGPGVAMADGLGQLYDDGKSVVSDVLSECPLEDEYMCIEPCCAQYMKHLSTKRMYDLHINSHGHKRAVQEGEHMKVQVMSTDDLEKRQKAMREFRCDVVGCPQFGNTLAMSQSYFKHLQTGSHLFPRRAPEVKGGSVDEDGAARMKPSCTVTGCMQHGRQFATDASYRRHLKSLPHRSAARSHLLADVRKTRTSPRTKPGARRVKMERDEDQGGSWTTTTVTACSSATPSPVFSISSRVFGKTESPHTPLSSPFSTPREEYLERRNWELEEELRQLKAQRLHDEMRWVEDAAGGMSGNIDRAYSPW